MNLSDIASIVGIAAIMVSGANWVILMFAKGFWNLVIKKIEERLKNLEDSERKNEAFRHKHEASVKSLEVLLSTFKDDLSLFEKNIDKKLDDIRKLISSQIDLAILRQEVKRNSKLLEKE